MSTSPSRGPHALSNRDKYLVIGGHGSVGRVVCQYLDAKFPGQVVAAGRDINAAAAFGELPAAVKTNEAPVVAATPLPGKVSA